MKHYKRSGSTAVAIILITYILFVLSSMQDNLDFLKYFTPFRYFDAGDMLQTGHMDVSFLLLSAVIIVVCLVSGYWIYNKRDLYI
jgi:ABC-2 type transport system permease protein